MTTPRRSRSPGSLRQDAADRPIPDTAWRAADLVGHLNLIHPARIQVFGAEEVSYYLRSTRAAASTTWTSCVTGGVPAIVMAMGTRARGSPDLCQAAQIPLLSTPPAAHLIDLLRIYLGKRLAPKTTVHGVFMDVLGLGVLITGESGLGKSELALELISRGHGLVADDAVELLTHRAQLHRGPLPRPCCRICSKSAAWDCLISARSSARPRCAAR